MDGRTFECFVELIASHENSSIYCSRLTIHTALIPLYRCHSLKVEALLKAEMKEKSQVQNG
jgi:hypothetical protein